MKSRWLCLIVIVISGPDKGAKGKVIEAYPKREKVLVEGVNRIKKHVANALQNVIVKNG